MMKKEEKIASEARNRKRISLTSTSHLLFTQKAQKPTEKNSL